MPVVITAGVIMVILVSRYAPLGPGNTSQFAGATLVESDPIDDVETYELPYRHGAEGDFSISITNNGRWTVTIEDFPILHQRVFSLLRIAAVEVAENTVSPKTPFTPFKLKPGEERLLTFRGIFTDCDAYDPKTGNAFDFVAVTYRFFWSTRTTTIPFNDRLKVTSPEDEACPLPRPLTPGEAPRPVPPLPSPTN